MAKNAAAMPQLVCMNCRRLSRSRFGTRDEALFAFTEPGTHRHSSLLCLGSLQAASACGDRAVLGTLCAVSGGFWARTTRVVPACGAERIEEVPMHFTVGFRLKGHTDRVTIDAEDALIAALKVKAERPEALITYVRHQNKRGDTRHPSHSLGKDTA